MSYKCSITHEYCQYKYGCYGDLGDSCPIGKYEDSFRYCEPGSRKSGALRIMDDTCRYLGIARSKELEKAKFIR